MFYNVNLSFVWSVILFTIMNPPKEDHGEMMLHHVLTITLIVLSYQMNVVNIGMIVL